MYEEVVERQVTITRILVVCFSFRDDWLFFLSDTRIL